MSRSRTRTLAAIAILIMIMLGLHTSVSYAHPPTLPAGDPVQPSAAGTMGVEWITDWPGTADDRANWYYSANNLYNELLNANFIGRFNWGQTNAWERDFKALSSGGNGLVDSVDFAMIGTHGTSSWDPRYHINLSAVYFSSNNDDWFLSPGEAYRAYGTNNLEWLTFDSCSVLRDDSRGYWHETFNGLHLMMGFANTMYVVYPGDGGVFGDQLQKKGWWIFGHGAKTVTQAWFAATEDQQPSGVRARVLAEELDNYNDYIWGQGYVSSDYPNNGGYWYWDHVSGTPAPLQIIRPPKSLPVYQIVPRRISDQYVMNIGQAFGLSGEVLHSPDGSALYMVGGEGDALQLRVDTKSGGFLFQNLDELWAKPEMQRNLPDPAKTPLSRIAQGFLSQHDNLPGAFSFDPQIAPTSMLEGPTQVTLRGAGADAQLSEVQQPLDYQVSYAQTLDIGDGQKISVVGPGARQNLYIGSDSKIIAMKGGWRQAQVVQIMGDDGVKMAATVPIRTADEAWSAFLQNPSIALAQPPLATSFDRTGKADPTLAYYEQPSTSGQLQLIPCWVFVADLYVDSNVPSAGASPAAVPALVASDVDIYVPAASDPTAQVQASISRPEPGLTIKPGQSVKLSGKATGGLAPYTFLWSSSVDGILGSGDAIEAPSLHPDLHGGSIQPNQITLFVSDANGQSASATVDVNVLVQISLPLALKVAE